jgi:hypothetical protein
MVFGEDIPETVISVIYAIKLGSELDRVFAVSAAGTILHLSFQLSEYWLIHQHLPALRQIAEGRDTTFEAEATDQEVCLFAQEYGDNVVFVSLKDCSNITDAAVLALAEHCAGIQTISRTGCRNITDAAVLALTEHCAGIQDISLGGCSSITDAAVLALVAPAAVAPRTLQCWRWQSIVPVSRPSISPAALVLAKLTVASLVLRTLKASGTETGSSGGGGSSSRRNGRRAPRRWRRREYLKSQGQGLN